MATVNEAIDTIKDHLSQGFTDWDVTHGDLVGINDALKEFEGEQLNQVLAGLSDDDLKNWSQEIYGTNGSLSTSERQDLFNNLAKNDLSPEQMIRIIDALQSEGNSDGVRELGAAVAAHSTDAQKTAFIEAMSARTTSGDNSYDPDPTHRNDVTDTLHADADAQAVAEVLASMTGTAFDQAVGKLNNQQLDAVMQAGIYQAETSTRNGNITNFDSSVATRLVNAAATSNDPAVKARVFDSAAEKLELIQKGGDNGAVPGGIGVDSRHEGARVGLADAMHGLLKTDPNGIVTELRVGTPGQASGQALQTLNRELLDAGKEDQIRELIIQLQQGNDGTGNAYQTVASNHDVARNIGYFTGTAVNALSDLNIERKEAADSLKAIFGVGYGAAGAANPTAGVIASVGNGLTAEAIDEIIGDFETGDGDTTQDLAQAFYELSLPRDPQGRIDDSRDSTIQDLKTEFASVTGVDVDD